MDLKKCLFIKPLGEGAYGKVNLYKDPENRKYFVTKTFMIKKLSTTSYQMFRNECKILKNLDHPNIRKLYYHDRQYMQLEYCPGLDMFYYLSRNVLTTDQTIDYFTQLVRGIDYLHLHGIAHLDIKLENVMIDFKTKTIKIIDFGHATDKPIVSYLGGTHPYIPPEAFVSNRIETSKADIWALGVILYEFIFKDFLWERSEINDPEFKKFSENKQLMALDLIEDIHLQTVLKNTLKIDSETRFSSSDILKCMELVNTIEIEC